MKQVILCGLPGAGKSTLAIKLGKYWQIPSYDLDVLIESGGCKISDLFAESEIVFRQTETEVLRHFLSAHLMTPFILALGGGALISMENRSLVTPFILAFVDTSPEECAQRLIRSGTLPERPLLVNTPREELTENLAVLREERLGGYLQSRIIGGFEDFNEPELFTKRVDLFTKKS